MYQLTHFNQSEYDDCQLMKSYVNTIKNTTWDTIMVKDCALSIYSNMTINKSLVNYDRKTWYKEYSSFSKYPKVLEKRINVAISTSDQYYMYALVVLKSLLKNNNTRPVFVYILELTPISDEHKACFERYNAQITFVKLYDEKDLISSQLPTAPSFPKAFIHILRLPHILLDVDKLLCLEADTLVDGDVGELYDIDMKDMYMVGCHPNYHSYNSLSMINGGVHLLNLKVMRDEKITYNYSIANLPVFTYTPYPTVEQYLIIFFGKRVIIADNYRFINNQYINKALEIDELVPLDPVIYHYFNNININYKPWNIFISDYSKPISIDSHVYSPQSIDIRSIKKWWDYAQFLPEYEKLRNDALLHVD